MEPPGQVRENSRTVPLNKTRSASRSTSAKASNKLTGPQTEGLKIIARNLDYFDLLNFCQTQDPRVCGEEVWRNLLQRDFPEIYNTTIADYEARKKRVSEHNVRAKRLAGGQNDEGSDEERSSPGAQKSTLQIWKEPTSPNYREIYEKAYFTKRFPLPRVVTVPDEYSDDEIEELEDEGKVTRSYPAEKWLKWAPKYRQFLEDIGEIKLNDIYEYHEQQLAKDLSAAEKINKQDLQLFNNEFSDREAWLKNPSYTIEKRREESRAPDAKTVLARQLKARLIFENPKLAQLDLKTSKMPQNISNSDYNLIQKHPELEVGVWEKYFNMPLRNGNIFLTKDRLTQKASILLKGKLVPTAYDNLDRALLDYLSPKTIEETKNYDARSLLNRKLQIIAAFAND